MNNKFLLIIIAAVIAVGGFMVLGGKKENPPSSVTSVSIPTPTQTALKEEIVTVTLTDKGFVPKEITIKTGTKVVWTNSSGKTATVDSADHPVHLLYLFLNLGAFNDEATLEVVFDKVGKYAYHNHYDSSQNGTVTVE